MAQAVDVVLPGDPGSPRRARRRLQPLVSELVAEAAGAFGGAPSEAISVHAEADRGRILASVQEGSKSFPTSSSVPEPATPGWSLYLVQRVSDDWGLRRAGDG